MNLTTRLIAEVKARPALWDRTHDFYNNRPAMENEWDHLSALLNKDKIFLRQKWKNLRDQFHKEYKRVKRVEGSDPSKPYKELYTGKWRYFSALIFLKDNVKTRCNSHPAALEEYGPETADTNSSVTVKEELIVYEEEKTPNYSNDFYGEEINLATAFQTNLEVPHSSTNSDSSEDENTGDIETGVKRKATDSQLPAKRDKLEGGENVDEIDGDLYFVKSLVPFLKRLPPVKKLIARNEIQNVLLKASLCDNCSGGACQNVSINN